MTTSGQSLFYFGIYGISAGLLFLFIPSTIISLTFLPILPNGWTRIIGMLAIVIGTYDVVCGKSNLKPFIKASIYVRLGFAIGAILIVLLGDMPFSIFLIGVVDALGAAWTFTALKSEVNKKQKIDKYNFSNR